MWCFRWLANSSNSRPKVCESGDDRQLVSMNIYDTVNKMRADNKLLGEKLAAEQGLKISAEQADKLKINEDIHAEDVRGFKATFERWGDHLLIKVTRRGVKTFVVVNLATRACMQLLNGYAPDRKGETTFYAVAYTGKPMRVIALEPAPESPFGSCNEHLQSINGGNGSGETGGGGGMGSRYGSSDIRLDFKVHNCARVACDDCIQFGRGKDSGYLLCPATLGEKTLCAMMKAIRKGAPTGDVNITVTRQSNDRT